MEKPKPGSVVRLRSGGPKMTVSEVDAGPDRVAVTWFDDAHVLHTGAFDVIALHVFSAP